MHKLPQRKNHRLKSHDYSAGGYYFITICTTEKKKLLWNMELVSSDPTQNLPLSDIGIKVEEEINKISRIYANVEIDKYVIMPNHLHMIIILHDVDGNGRSKTAPTNYERVNVLNGEGLQTPPTISRIIQQFKGSLSKQVEFSIWQKSFYDHIIRKPEEYLKIWNYIDENPLKWKEDKYYTE